MSESIKLKRVKIEDFGVTSREKALKIVSNINKKSRRIFFETDGINDYFVLNEETYPELFAVLNVEKIEKLTKAYTEVINKVEEIDNKFEKLNKQVSELTLKKEPLIKQKAEQEIKQESKIEETYEPLKFKIKGKEKEQKEKYILTPERFFCPHCNQNVTVDIPYKKDKNGKLVKLKIEKIKCPNCGNIIYSKVSNKKVKIVRALQLIFAVPFLWFFYWHMYSLILWQNFSLNTEIITNIIGYVLSLVVIVSLEIFRRRKLERKSLSNTE